MAASLEGKADLTSTEALMAALLNYGGSPADKILITGDEVAFHKDPANKQITLPQGFGFAQTIKILERKRAEQEEPTSFQRIYRYRYPDGANAMTEVLKARYGITLAKGQQTFFGTRPAETLEVAVGVDKTKTCLWGTVEIPSLDGAEIYLTGTRDPQFGTVFATQFTGPRKHKAEVEALFNDVDKYLKEHSIYRGHPLVGADSLDFMDLSTFDPRQVVFASTVDEQLDNLLYGPIRNTALFRKENIPLKRAILLHGPFGTGKTSVGMITAQIAEEHGWTFITAKPEDNVRDVMRTAQLYQPAVVLVEDVETQSSSADPRAVSKLLDTFDGATAKGNDIIMVLTTNHIDDIHKGMLRPGRIDATVEIAELDREGIERLIKAVVNPMKLDETVDYDAVYEQMVGFLPAFVKQAIDRAKTWAVNSQGFDYVLTTADLAGAAMSLHDQLARMNGASEGKVGPELVTALQTVVGDKVTDLLGKTEVWAPEYEAWGAVRVGDGN